MKHHADLTTRAVRTREGGLQQKEPTVPTTTFRLAVAAMLSFASASAPTAEPVVVPMTVDSAGGITVWTTINGRGPFPFLLDTGASHSVVSDTLSERLGLVPMALTQVMTSTQFEPRRVVRIETTAIGPTAVTEILASVVEARRLAGLALNIQGIIGQDFLLALNYTLDYRKKRLTWNARGTPTPGTRLPLVVRNGRFLLQVNLGDDQAPAMLVPDSGASGLVVYAREGRTRLPLEAAQSAWEMHSLSGAQRVPTGILRELRLGDVVMRNQVAAVVDRGPIGADHGDGDGLLPLHLFASVTFDAREQSLVIR
jgi:predicted aspartyl protease